MSDRTRKGSGGDPDDLATRALLYAAGLLDARAATDFEALLAVSQPARDLLAAAVGETLGDRAPRPTGAYRRAVLRRHGPSPVGRFCGRRTLVGVVAAAAAVLITAGLASRPAPEPGAALTVPVAPEAIARPGPAPVLAPRHSPELPPPQPLHQVQDGQPQRKKRDERVQCPDAARRAGLIFITETH